MALTTRTSTRRVYFVSNPDKAEASAALDHLCGFAGKLCNVVGRQEEIDGRNAVSAQADRIVVLGGDGTLIGVARSLGRHQIPLIGVNLGKLGFLTEFSIQDLKRCFGRAIDDDTIISRRMGLHVTVRHDGAITDMGLAINDCVIQAGPPFRMIRMGVSIDGQHLTDVAGDGLIVCTPSGSTAHNLSAGGPIMESGVHAIVMTPLSPHSLTHRPLVIERGSVIDIVAEKVNPGTTAIIDGQVSCALHPGDHVSVHRFENDVLLVHNPLYTRWYNLITKLHWGQAPAHE